MLVPFGTRLPRLVWNASASVPVGLYVISSAHACNATLALIRLPSNLANFAALRGYVPRTVYLLKPIAASAGDRVCRDGPRITINTHARAFVKARDRLGRALPTWAGCMILRADQVFVLGTKPDSFDSRYFGPMPTTAIVGRAIPVWISQD